LLILVIAGASAVYAATSPRNPGYAQGRAEASSDLTYSGLTAYGTAAGGQALALPAQPLTLSSNAAQPTIASSLLAGDNDGLRLAAARAGDPLPPASPANQASPIPTTAPTPSATPTPADPACEKAANGLYCVYTVQSGDTLSTIAKSFGLKGTAGVASWEMLVQSNKPDITSADDFIQPGQKLRIAARNGIVHLVLTGETLGELADDYGVAITAIVGGGSNASGALTIGDDVLITDPAHLPPVHPAPVAPPAIPTPQSNPTDTPTPDAAAATATATPRPAAAGIGTATPTGSATPARTGTPAAPAKSKSGFIWPTTGPISSYFGPNHPLGIDIDLYANPNAPILAAAAGTVTFAGGNTCCSYGLYVIVDHGNGYSTLYAHLSKISVASGQQVTQGQLLGLGGRTGYATGNHLHFEVRINGNVIDPLSVLP
jgi:murein DD-endopeptidase MepM/ murein hydrolase activator NlpD